MFEDLAAEGIRTHEGGYWVGGALGLPMGLLCASSRVALATSGVQLGKRVVEQLSSKILLLRAQ